MLTIRREQMEALRLAQVEEFVTRARAHLRTMTPEAAEASVEELTDFVRFAIAKAEYYGIEYENDALQFLHLMCYLGADFDQDSELPWVAEILNDREVSPHLKLEFLLSEAAQGAQVPLEEGEE